MAIGSASTDGIINSQNLAYIGNDTNVTAGAIDIQSELTRMLGDADLLAATGGVVSVGTTRAILDMNPAAGAFIGAGVTVNSGDVTVQTTGRAEGDARSQSSGGGAVQVGVAYAKTTVNPVLDAYIAPATIVRATGNVKVNAVLLAAATPAPRDVIEDSPADADNLAVDVNLDTVDFAIPVTTGDTLTYSAPQSQTAFGLTTGRVYHAIVVEPGQNLQLGDQFESALVDGRTDEIKFSTPHAFQPGDAVRYDARGGVSIVEPWQTSLPTNHPLYVDPSSVLYVRGVFTDPNDPKTIDRTRIRLAKTAAQATANENSLLKSFSAASDVDHVASRITLANHGFIDGQPVTYRAAASAAFLTEAADATVVDRSVTTNGSTVTVKDVKRNADQEVIHVDNNRIFIPQHGFRTGDAVTYTSDDPIGGLSNDTTYFVIVIDVNQVQLARTYFEAVGRNLDDRGNSDAGDDILAVPVSAIPLNPTGNQKQLHRLDRNLQGLRNNQTYYVANVTANSFQLLDSPGGSPVAIDFVDVVPVYQRNGVQLADAVFETRGGQHRLGTFGIDLRPGTETQAVRIDLTGQPDNTVHRFLGASPAAALGDGISSATAIGGSGGGIDVSVPTGLLNTVPTVKARIDAIEVQADGSITLGASANTSNKTRADTVVEVSPQSEKPMRIR